MTTYKRVGSEWVPEETELESLKVQKKVAEPVKSVKHVETEKSSSPSTISDEEFALLMTALTVNICCM